MAITRAQIAKQLLANGGEVLGPLGEEDNLQSGFVSTVGRVLSPGNVGRGLAFILSGGLSGGASAVAKEIAKQRILDEASRKAGDIIRPRIETKVMQQDNMIRNTGGYQSDFGRDSDFMGGKGTAAEMGSFAVGGLADGNFDFESARQMYGLGKLVKKVTRTVKKIAKSPVGKVAIAAGIAGIPFGGGKFFGSGSLFGKAKTFFGAGSLNPLLRKTVGEDIAQSAFGSMLSGIPGGAETAAITATSLIPLLGLGTGEETEEEAEELIRGSGLDINTIRANPNQFLGRRFRAEGGSMKEPVAKKTMPLLDMGGKEMDLRAEGGFVPIGRMEKADDVPARLSKNEFVFTADAVRNAGDGDVDKGAEVMYNMMKNLEAGGDVSKESQGLEGARKMFQTSQRLEEVL